MSEVIYTESCHAGLLCMALNLGDCLGSFASCENGIVLSREALSRFASDKQSITMINEVIMTLDMPLGCRCSRRNQSPPKVGEIIENITP